MLLVYHRDTECFCFFFNSLLSALNYHKCWFGHQLSLITVTYEQKNLKVCTFTSSSLQSNSASCPEGLEGRLARHKLMQAFQEWYKMTHTGLSWLLEIPSNSHFTMLTGSVLDKGAPVSEHLEKKGGGNSSQCEPKALRTKPHDITKRSFFLKGARLCHTS